MKNFTKADVKNAMLKTLNLALKQNKVGIYKTNLVRNDHISVDRYMGYLKEYSVKWFKDRETPLIFDDTYETTELYLGYGDSIKEAIEHSIRMVTLGKLFKVK